MTRQLLIAVLVISLGFSLLPAQAAQPHRTDREQLIQRLKERDRWGKTQRTVINSIILAKHIVKRRFGWVDRQWRALKALWSHESGWQWWIRNGSSGACGIPQFHPCSKGGPLFMKGPVVQIRKGGFYIEEIHGTPIGACGSDGCHSGTY